MAKFDRLAYREPRPSPDLIHAVGFFNQHVLLPWVLRVREIDFPAEDVERLRSVLRAGAAAFIAPNHPENMTDWIIDKELSRRVSPLMAHWASYEVVNAHPVAQWFWLRNNLIANAPGGSGREYSIRWARAGHGVLLHPEGKPTWHSDWVAPLVGGAIDMAWETASDGGGPAYVAPVVWKLHFVGSVERQLHGELAYLEKSLGLASGSGLGLGERFAAFHLVVLARSLSKYGSPLPEAHDGFAYAEFFRVQRAHVDGLLAELETRHGASEGNRARRIHKMRRAIHEFAGEDAAATRRDQRVLAEVERLAHFAAARYAGPHITQEQMAESLKQSRLALLKRGWRDAAHQVLPIAVARRLARIRVCEPIEVMPAGVEDDEGAAAKRDMLTELRRRLQDRLDHINDEIAPLVKPHAVTNPFH